MSERLYNRPCAVCGCNLDITLDMMSEDIVIRAQNLDPLAKDSLQVVSTYKRLKGLGATWQQKHGARGIIYANALLVAVGSHGGQLDRACALLGWLSDSKKDWGLDDAPSHYPAYQKHLEAVTVRLKGRCKTCGESYAKSFTDLSDDCGRHS